jgi:hypothetical protein
MSKSLIYKEKLAFLAIFPNSSCWEFPTNGEKLRENGVKKLPSRLRRKTAITDTEK